MNQFHEQGIRWRILALSLSINSNQSGWTTISTDSAFSSFLQEQAAFIDIRPEEDYNTDHIPGAISLPFFPFFKKPDLFQNRDKDTIVILYDLERNSKKVRMLGRQLHSMGFKQVKVLRGGYVEWLDKGYTVEKGYEQWLDIKCYTRFQ